MPNKKTNDKFKYSKSNSPKGDDSRKVGTRKTNYCRDNDVSWYTKYPSLVTAASNIIFNKPYGSILPTKDYLSAGIGTNNYNSAVPGGYVAFFANALTSNGSAESPLNVALKNFQTYVRHANSGSVNYEGSDLMQYLLTVVSLIPWFERLKRDLRLILTYKATNKYVYKALLEAEGYLTADINAMTQDYAQYITKLNILIAQFNSFKVPNDISLIARRTWLSSMVFKDDELDKASLYMFTPNDYLHYDWANAELQTRVLGGNFNTVYSALVTEVNNLLSYEDVGVMIGDILKAYGDSACHYVSPITIGDVQDAVYSQEAGEQFRNLCCTGTYPQPITYRQVSSNSQLLETVQTHNMSNFVGKFIYVDSPSAYAVFKGQFPIGFTQRPILMADADAPDSSKVLVNTRLQFIQRVVDYDDNATAVIFDAVAHGTEVITEIRTMSYGVKLDGSNLKLNVDNTYKTFGIHALSGAVGAISSVYELYPTRFAPQYCAILYDDAGTGVIYPINLYNGLNIIVLEEEWLQNIHMGCLLSLISLPMFKLLESK